MSGASAKRTRLSRPAATDRHENVEKQRQEMLGNDQNRMALKAKDKLREYLDSMTEEELTRYEHYRRSSFKHETIKQLMLRTIKTTEVKPVADAEMKRISIIMAGLTKMYIGSIVEEAKHVMMKRGNTGPIHPHHVREAYRRLKNQGKLIHLDKGLSGV